MMRRSLAIVLGILALAQWCTAQEEASERFARTISFPAAKEWLVVAEGDFEPQDSGSYGIRIYSGANMDNPLDDFVIGLVMPRKGSVQDVRFADLDGDNIQDIVVVVGAPGSSGKVAADAFKYKDRLIRPLASVFDLAADADPIQALKAQLASNIPTVESTATTDTLTTDSATTDTFAVPNR
jgi:hypothetical protein